MPLRSLVARALPAVLVLALAPRPALAGGDDPVNYQPYPLGVLDGVAEHRFGEDFLRIKELPPGSPLVKAGIGVTDEILGVALGDHQQEFKPDDKTYMTGGTGPLRTLGLALDEASGNPRTTFRLLIRRREVKNQWIKVEVPQVGSFSPQFPVKCPKSDKMFTGACEWMLRRRESGGNLGGNVTTSLMGLAFMCHPDRRFQAAARQAAEWTQRSMAKPSSVGSNWMLAWAGIFLSEYNWRHPDANRQAVLQAICDELVVRQLKDPKGPEGDHAGTFFHGRDACYGGKGLNIVTTAAMWCWASSAKLNKVKLNQAAWDRSFRYVQRSCGDEGRGQFIGYNASCVDNDQSAGRSGQMAQALMFAGDAPSRQWASKLGISLLEHSPRSREAHAITVLGIVPASASIWRLQGPAGYHKHMQEWRWYLTLMMQADGSARFVPGKANNGGDFYLGFDNSANCIAALMLAAPSRRLAMFGADRKSDEVEPTGDAGDTGYGGDYGTPSEAPSETPSAATGPAAPAPLNLPPPEPTELFGVPLAGAKVKSLGDAVVEANDAIAEGRYSRAIQRLDGMLKRQNLNELQKKVAEAMRAHCYASLAPQLDLVDESLAKGEALEAARRYDQFMAQNSHAPELAPRLQALLARLTSPEMRQQAQLGAEYEQLLMFLLSNPTIPYNRQRMEAFAAAHAGTLYGRKAAESVAAIPTGADPQSAVKNP